MTTTREYTTFITGATGFIAFELLKNIIENESSGNIYLLIRARSNQTVEQRYAMFLTELQDHIISEKKKDIQERIQWIEGDITLPKLGMKSDTYENLTRKVTRIYHVAASVHLTGPLDTMRLTNVEGTRNLLDFALLSKANGAFDLFNYVSTAYVAGNRSGVIYENELCENQQFNNNYERAKYEAECLVSGYAKKLPIAIYRPSIVMGHSITGWTKTFNVLYEPMKMVYFGGLKLAPSNRNSIVDIVPVDYVAKGIYHISTLKEKAVSRTFHLSMGRENTIRFPLVIKQITASLFKWSDYYKVENPKIAPILLPAFVFKLLAKITYVFSGDGQRRKISKMLTYTDYVAISKEYDAHSAEEILKPLGIVCPKVDAYLDILCKYAVKTHFGKSSKPEHVFNRKSGKKLRSELKKVVANSF